MVKAKYDLIGKGYNATRKADPYLFSRLLFHLNPTAGGKYLDIGCGTGNYTKEFDRRGYRFVGVDPSAEMLKKAKAGVNSVEWILAKAETLDVPDLSFDGIVASLTLHHWQDPSEGFTRLYNSLKKKGILVIFTASPRQMEGYWLNHFFPRLMKDSIAQMPSLNAVSTLLNSSGFSITETEPYFIQPDLQDLFLYSGKHDPLKYLDPGMRKGISSFAALADSEEVENGLQLLKAAIDSGEIETIIRSYENDGGDYLFIVAKKE